MPSEKGAGINCFGLFTRSDKSWTAVSEKTIDAAFVVEQLERFSFSLSKPTVVVLDNARIHTGRKMSERIGAWQRRGLFVFYLPTYSPHLNIAEGGLAETQIRMAVGGRLRVKRASAICGQAGTFGIWKKPENQILRLQT